MTTSERIFVGVFGVLFSTAILSTPFLGFLPILGCCVGILMLGAAAHLLDPNVRDRTAKTQRKGRSGNSE